MTPERLQRFTSKVRVDEATGCWFWTAALTNFGYGQFYVPERERTDGRTERLAHRAAYEHWKGSIPDGYEVAHLCKARHCVNPEHLEAVTPRENNMRSDGPSARNARKTHCDAGHPFATLGGSRDGGTARYCMECTRLRTRRYRGEGSVRRPCPACGSLAHGGRICLLREVPQ